MLVLGMGIMRLKQQKLFFASVVLLAMVTFRSALACGVCITFAEDTISDRLLSAQVIVIASPASDKPFTFEPQKVLAGDKSILEDIPEIPFLVDSSLRALRASGEPVGVVMTYGTDNLSKRIAGSKSKWHRLFSVNDERLAFVRALLDEGETWPVGATQDPEQVAFYSSYLSEQDELLRDAALIELDRAPYPLLTGVSQPSLTPVLLESFTRLERAAFTPISLKLLAMDERASTKQLLRRLYPSALQNSGSTLHAWALVAVKLDETEGLATIEERLQSGALSDAARLQLVLALADAGTATPALRSDIARIFSASLDQSVVGLAEIASAVRSWHDTSLTPVFSTLLQRDNLHPATRFALRSAVGIDG